MKKIIIGILTLIVGIVIVFFFTKEALANSKTGKEYKIVKKWNLPEDLNEISGIAWIGDNRVACVQDEDGVIYVYNMENSKIEKSVTFAGAGDFEGIAVIGKSAYILRSDGVVFEVSGFLGNPKVKKHVTGTNKLPGINFEGLTADAKNNRLLLAVKKRKEQPRYKEIFAFDLDKKETGKDPLFMMDLQNPIFDEVPGKLKKRFRPGEIGIHPQTGEFYILDGTNPKLLIAGKDGTPKELIMLNPSDFGNPEGITFSPEGEFYISNEAEGAPANILLVSLDRK